MLCTDIGEKRRYSHRSASSRNGKVRIPTKAKIQKCFVLFYPTENKIKFMHIQFWLKPILIEQSPAKRG